MKKLLVVLLALGLLVAFGTTASAVDVKFSGMYYSAGVYENNRSLQDSDHAYSRHYIWTRTRIQTEFQIAEGLSFTTRFDAFEKQWGNANRSSSATEDKSNSGRINVNTTTGVANGALQENIEMEYGYVTFKTMVGQFDIGYQAADEWGTVYGDVPGSRPRIKYTTVFGPVTLLGIYEKVFSSDATGGTGSSTLVSGQKSDADSDNYAVAGIYKWSSNEAGLLLKFVNQAQNRPAAAMRTQYYLALPYVKATFGPLYVEAEGVYVTGKTAQYESPSTAADISKEGYGAYVLAKMNIGPAYVGGQFGYTSGNDQVNAAGHNMSASTDGKDRQGVQSSTSWTPALIFGNANLRSWMYGVDIGNGAAGTAVMYDNNYKQNLLLYNVFAGFNPTPKINVQTAFSYMYADKKPVNFVSDKYGYEWDLQATYKIYDNLTYMVGYGYLWTGDYFKGTSDSTPIGNDYIVLNQLTLNF
jgi:hypothetical protein